MSVEGTYKVTVKTPVGLQEGTLVLKVAGGALSGSLDNPKGRSEFTGGTVAGETVHFATKIRTPMGRLKAEVNGRVSDDTFTGEARLPLGTAQIAGTRVRPE